MITKVTLALILTLILPKNKFNAEVGEIDFF
jgi:hypothetical protein